MTIRDMNDAIRNAPKTQTTGLTIISSGQGGNYNQWLNSYNFFSLVETLRMIIDGDVYIAKATFYNQLYNDYSIHRLGITKNE